MDDILPFLRDEALVAVPLAELPDTTAVGEPPCTTCRHFARCRDNLLACTEFLCYVEGIEDERADTDPHAEIYDFIFENAPFTNLERAEINQSGPWQLMFEFYMRGFVMGLEDAPLAKDATYRQARDYVLDLRRGRGGITPGPSTLELIFRLLGLENPPKFRAICKWLYYRAYEKVVLRNEGHCQ